ncbi:hypothetical protein [Halobacillus andaensis]|uniref:hypothetical protein n=1 Tax=Halobacillus andaensis TaxID=1176239 RepID=UPI003D755EC3
MDQEEIKAKLRNSYYSKAPLIDFQYKLPIKVKYDSDYENALEDILYDYLRCIKERVDNTVFRNTSNNISLIINAIKYYYESNISKAKEVINELLNAYISDKHIVSSLDESPALRGSTRTNTNTINNNKAYSDLSFFKARSRKGKYTRKDFLHIPFNKRGIVATQRFSIAGVPCMYFGASSFVCWIELGKPDEDEFYISSYEIPKKIKVLNLAITKNLIHGFAKQKLNSLIEFFPLVIATSFSVSEENRNFKSEYIVSQLIMQSLTELEIDGVAYISKRVQHHDERIQMGMENFPSCVNLAIPMKREVNELYSDFAKDIQLTKPINYKEFLNSKPTLNGDKVSFANLFEDSSVIYNGKQVNFTSLPFSQLDNYLVNLEHRTYENNKRN